MEDVGATVQPSERLYCLTQMVIFNTSGVRNVQLTVKPGPACACSLARHAPTHLNSVVALFLVRALRSLHQAYTRRCLNWRRNDILSSHFLLKTFRLTCLNGSPTESLIENMMII